MTYPKRYGRLTNHGVYGGFGEQSEHAARAAARQWQLQQAGEYIDWFKQSRAANLPRPRRVRYGEQGVPSAVTQPPSDVYVVSGLTEPKYRRPSRT